MTQMTPVWLAGAVLFLTTVSVLPQPVSGEREVRAAVEAFYAAFNSHDFSRVPVTEDWEHVNPFGGTARGRETVLKELREVHSTFLKGVTDTVIQMTVRMASADVAIATVTSQMSTYTTPNGSRYENEQHIRTFVVVKRENRWLIMHDQNTTIQSPN